MAAGAPPAAVLPAVTEPAPPHRISLGVQAGDAYAPVGLAVDAGRKLAYLYNTPLGDVDPGGAAISVVDLERRAVSRASFWCRPPTGRTTDGCCYHRMGTRAMSSTRTRTS